MTILTIITNLNDDTVYFEKPLERGFEYIRLIKSSLYNSWYNLKNRGEIGFVDNSGITTTKVIPPGNYTLSSIGKKLEEIFNDEGIEVKFDDVKGPIVIENPLGRKVLFDHDLTYLLGLSTVNPKERFKKNQTVINHLASFNNYFIHCDLMDKDENLFNGNPSTILACFDINGKSFERVEYSPKEITTKKITSGKYISSIRITVTDENGELIDFNYLPLRFEKMSEQNIIPSAPPLYPSLQRESVGDYRLKKISDCQKELENEISHYLRISKKYKRAKTIIKAFAASTGVLTVTLSSASLATSLTLIGAIAGAPIAGIAALMGIASTAAGVSSGRLNKKVTKHEKTISLAESKLLSVSRLVSKALTDGEVSDVEFNLILREIENYYFLKGQLRREVRIENKSSDKNVDVEVIKKEIKKNINKSSGPS